MSIRYQRLFTNLTCALILFLAFTTIAQAAQSVPALSQGPVIREKADQAITAQAREFLSTRNPEQATVWVFFTDKGVRTKGEFQALATSLSVTALSQKRRAKVGMDRIVFADLPVTQRYVDGVTAQGAKLRRVSRWLNAASYEIPIDRLDAVAALPYVASVQPVAGYKNDYSDAEEAKPTLPQKAQAPDALSYGQSLAQLQQINVPYAHSLGYAGQGVTLAVFDTGFRKSHAAFAEAYAENRVLAEHDFIFNDGNTANEPEDVLSQWNHGTYTWSTSGGLVDGTLFGPAYRANFILAKTEDVRSETPVEEDNWIAALEWVDSLGADVVTSSLAYADWYTYADVNGETAPITIAANTADGLGIIVCNAMGNEGPGVGTLHPPADAYNILACGAVTSSGTIASFSSRGPTYDGRTKPEVCAQGVSTFCATPSNDDSYGYVSGTSLSTPLVAGAVCIMISARPNFTPEMIRRSLMETASQASTPDNNYGWGIINLEDALSWGAQFSADVTWGTAPMTVQFTDESTLSTSTWSWDFGDGTGSDEQNPVHEYTNPGAFDVSLTIQSPYGPITNVQQAYVVALGDTLQFGVDSAFAGQEVVSRIYLTNSQPLNEIQLAFIAPDTPLDITFDSVAFGDRTGYFEKRQYLTYAPGSNKFAVNLIADYGGGAPLLPAGSGEVARVYWRTDPWAVGGLSNQIDTTLETLQHLQLVSDRVTYVPVVYPGEIRTISVLRGDVNYDHIRNLSDITGIIGYVYLGTSTPVSLSAADVNNDHMINLQDITGLIGFIYLDGPPPINP